MKSTLRKLITAAVISGVALAAPAFAINFSSGNNDGVFLSAGQTKTGTFNITTGNTPNFVPATMVLSSATVRFAFADTNEPHTIFNWSDEGDWFKSDLETVSVTLDTLFFMSGEVDGSHPSASYDWSSINGTVSGSILSSLQADGKLNFVVTVTSGDTWYKGARLDAVGDLRQNTPGVPDGGSTVLLLGSAIAALGLVARRRKVA